jgi:hypothetical protein
LHFICSSQITGVGAKLSPSFVVLESGMSLVLLLLHCCHTHKVKSQERASFQVHLLWANFFLPHSFTILYSPQLPVVQFELHFQNSPTVQVSFYMMATTINSMPMNWPNTGSTLIMGYFVPEMLLVIPTTSATQQMYCSLA